MPLPSLGVVKQPPSAGTPTLFRLAGFGALARTSAPLWQGAVTSRSRRLTWLSRRRLSRGAAMAAAAKQALADAVDWARAMTRHEYGPGYTVTPADVQLRAWADFGLEVSLAEAESALREML
jgi:hypothetical protein